MTGLSRVEWRGLAVPPRDIAIPYILVLSGNIFVYMSKGRGNKESQRFEKSHCQLARRLRTEKNLWAVSTTNEGNGWCQISVIESTNILKISCEA